MRLRLPALFPGGFGPLRPSRQKKALPASALQRAATVFEEKRAVVGNTGTPSAFLLFPQLCLAAAVAGILAYRFPAPGAVLLGAVLFFAVLRAAPDASGEDRGLRQSVARFALLCCCFAAACGYTAWREPEMPPLPPALQAAVFPSNGDEAVVSLSARVDECVGLPGGRLRLVLSDLRVPADAPVPWSGRAVWNRYGYTPEKHGPPPLPGDTLHGEMRLLPVRGFANPETWDTEQYWQDRKVWLRTRQAGKSAPEFQPPGTALQTVSSLPVNGAGGACRLLHEARRTAYDRFIAALPGESRAAGILPALVFGDRSRISTEQADLFARATLAHSLALSGLHLGFAVMAGYGLAVVAGRIRPSLYLRVPRPKLALLCALPFGLAYLWLGQAPVSLMRAFCMLLFWTLLVFLNRPRVLLDGLFAAAAVLLVYTPTALFDVGFQLSVLSVATIALSLPKIQAATDELCKRLFSSGKARGRSGAAALTGVRSRVEKLVRGACVMLGISLCIQVVLLPVTLRVFGMSGLLFPLNLLWLPVLGAVVMPLAFAGLPAAALGLHSLAAAMLSLAALPCDALLAALERLDAAGLLLSPWMPRPHWTFAAGCWLLLIGLPGLWDCVRRKRKGTANLRSVRLRAVPGAGACLLLAVPLCLAAYEAQHTHVRLRLLDVGQGQAVLVEWGGLDAGGSGGRTSGRVLVDGGGFPFTSFDIGQAVLAPVLTKNALPHVDALINSHPDADHLGGLLYLLEHFSVGAYYGNGDRAMPAAEEREQRALAHSGLKKKTLAAGDRIELGPDLVLDVLWPPAAVREEFAARKPGREAGNNASLVLRLLWRGKPLALLCGDIERPAIQALLESPETPAAPVLVLPHHGAAGALAPELYAAVQPKAALAAAGFRNRWGFPSPLVVEALERSGVPVFSTSEYGQIALEWREPSGEFTMGTAFGE